MDLPPNAPRRKCDRYILHSDELKSILDNLQNETESKQNGRQRRESENKNSKDPFRGDFSAVFGNYTFSVSRNRPRRMSSNNLAVFCAQELADSGL